MAYYNIVRRRTCQTRKVILHYNTEGASKPVRIVKAVDSMQVGEDEYKNANERLQYWFTKKSYIDGSSSQLRINPL